MKSLIFFFYLSTAPFSFGQNLDIRQSGLVFPLQAEHTHGSSIVELPNGDLLVAWFQGSGERKSDDVRIMGARLKKGSKVWTNPFLMADTPHIPDCNPVLFLNHNKELFLVWIAVNANHWENSILRLRRTKNYNGNAAPDWTWQDNIILKPGEEFAVEIEKKLKELPSTGLGWAGYAPKYDQQIINAAKDPAKRSIGWMTRIKPLLLPKSKIILPLYSDGFNLSIMAISEDDGNTWLPSLPLVGRGPIQPALALKKDGTIAAYMRDSGDAPERVHYSESKDLGKSWTSSVKTEIPNTASVEILVLRDGRWVYVGNDMNGGRTQLSLYVSNDEGQTWIQKYKLEDQEGGYSYPSLIQGENGWIYLTYSYHLPNKKKSIKYVEIGLKQ